MSAGGFAGVALLLSECISCTRNANGQINWETFLQLLRALAAGSTEARNQEEYVADVADIVRRLKLTDRHIRKPLIDLRARLLIGPEFTALEREVDFEVLSIVFDKGQLIPHHDHPNMTGVMGCASGRLLVRSYERVGGPDNRDGCTLRELGSRELFSGDVCTLTAIRANIHTVVANERTQVVDIFTPPYEADPTRRMHWYEVDSAPVDRGGSVYRAVAF